MMMLSKAISLICTAALTGGLLQSATITTAAGAPDGVPTTASAELPPVTAKGWRLLPAGRIVEIHPAPQTSHVAGARRSLFVRYTSTNRLGKRSLASGLVLLPKVAHGRSGRPLAVYGHMTTGAADACAPTHGVPESTEIRRMQQGDRVAEGLLALGVVVARPDYEGVGERGPHPYLRGASLGRSMVDLASAVKHRFGAVGEEWVAVGHSEGGVAALNAGSRRVHAAKKLRLVGIAAITPVTQMEVIATAFGDLPVGGYPISVVVSLAALMLQGLASEDPGFKKLLLQQGGLSPEAKALWPDLDRLCLEDLGRTESWGGLSPRQVKGPRGDEALEELKTALAEDDIRHLRMRRGVPIRIDAGALDTVQPLPLTAELVHDYQSRGYATELKVWPTDHSPTADMAAPELVAWILAQFQ